jgi:hypothetical protein
VLPATFPVRFVGLSLTRSDSLCVLDFPSLASSSYLEDDENGEIGFRVRDYRARGGVPRGALGRSSGGQGTRSCPGCGETSRSRHRAGMCTSSGSSDPGRWWAAALVGRDEPRSCSPFAEPHRYLTLSSQCPHRAGVASCARPPSQNPSRGLPRHLPNAAILLIRGEKEPKVSTRRRSARCQLCNFKSSNPG